MIYTRKFDGTEKVRFHLILEKDLHDRIELKAAEIGIKRNGLICNILAEQFKNVEEVEIVK